jgi:integrase
VRLAVAIDRFLETMQLERDWTPRSVSDVYGYLAKLADELGPEARMHELDGKHGKELVRAHLAGRYGRRSSTTRAKVISYFHSFFAWAEDEDLIADDRVREIKRPPKRKPDVYKPSGGEMKLLLRASSPLELGALLLMSGAGLRASEVVAVVWRDVDTTEGRVRIRRKGGHWQWLPVDPLVVERLRDVYRVLEPELDDHVFVAETERWVSNEHRIRKLIDPKTPRSPHALWSMVQRASARAGVRPLGPHMLRRGFANEFLRDTRSEFGTADVWTLKLLMGHSRIDTTEGYLKELETDDARDVLRRLRLSQSEGDVSQASNVLAFPLMEAAGIEPASAPSSDEEPGGTGDDADPRSHKRRLTSEHASDEGGDDGSS